MMPDTSTKKQQPAGMNIEESHVILKTQPDPPHGASEHGGHGGHGLGWQSRLEQALHSVTAERIVVFLLVIDCACVIAIMVMDAHFYNGKANDIKDHLKKCRNNGFDYCEPGGKQPEYGDQKLYDWEKTLHWCSVGILCIFAVEVTLTVIAKGTRYFQTENWPFWLDFIVVWASLLVDLLATNVSLGWLIFIRLWRIVRVVHGQHHLESDIKKKAIAKVRKSVSDEIERHTSGSSIPE